MDKIKLAQRTIALLSSMIESGECHTTRSREMKNNALNGLEQLTIPVVVGSEERAELVCEQGNHSHNLDVLHLGCCTKCGGNKIREAI